VKREDFLDAVGQIDEHYIEEAASSKKRPGAAKIIRPIALLAAAVVLFFGIRLVFRTIRPGDKESRDMTVITNSTGEEKGNASGGQVLPGEQEETGERSGDLTRESMAEEKESGLTEKAETAAPKDDQNGKGLTEKAETPGGYEEQYSEEAAYSDEAPSEAAEAPGNDASTIPHAAGTTEPGGAAEAGATGEAPGGEIAFLQERSRDVSAFVTIRTADCPWEKEDFLLYLASSEKIVTDLKAEAADGRILKPLAEEIDQSGIRQLYEIRKTLKSPGGLVRGEIFAYGLVYDSEGMLNLLHPLTLTYEPEEISEEMKDLADSVK